MVQSVVKDSSPWSGDPTALSRHPSLEPGLSLCLGRMFESEVHVLLFSSTPRLLNSFLSCSNTSFSFSLLPSLSEQLALFLSFIYDMLISDSAYHTKCCHTKPCVELRCCPKLEKHQHLNANLLISLWASGPTLPRLLHLTSLLYSIY